jgi:hypothetical protein
LGYPHDEFPQIPNSKAFTVALPSFVPKYPEGMMVEPLAWLSKKQYLTVVNHACM